MCRGRLHVAVLLDSLAPLPALVGLNSQAAEALEIDELRLDIRIRETSGHKFTAHDLLGIVKLCSATRH